MATTVAPLRQAGWPSLADAVRRTVAYADIFEYPLSADEVFRFLPVASARPMVDRTIAALVEDGVLREHDGQLFLPGRDDLVRVRRERGIIAQQRWRRARRYGRVIWALPFVRMVAITGALAMNNCPPGDDIDFLVVTEAGRLWTTRGMIVLVCRIARLGGDTLCPNYLLSENALRLDGQDLYAAHELVQMIPLHGRETAARLWAENSWCRVMLPHARPAVPGGDEDRLPPVVGGLKRAGERILRLPLAKRVERWERRRKIARLSALVPPGNQEALYTADVCKGHDRGHGRRIMTLLAFQTTEGGADR
jgi:hypothetical protein